MSIATQQRYGGTAPYRGGRGVRVEWSLEPDDPGSVSRLRHEILRYLENLADPGADLTDAQIVIGELLSNAVKHTSGRSWVSLRWDGTHPLLSVADVGPGFPPPDGAGRGPLERRAFTPRLPADPMATGGRGLYLVSRLALDIAVSPRRTGGTVVSVTLDLTRSPSS